MSATDVSAEVAKCDVDFLRMGTYPIEEDDAVLVELIATGVEGREGLIGLVIVSVGVA